MARNRLNCPMVPWSPTLHVVSDGPGYLNSGDDVERFDRQDDVLSERDTVLDQADGARGAEQALRPEPEPGPMGQKSRETGRLSARRGPKTGR